MSFPKYYMATTELVFGNIIYDEFSKRPTLELIFDGELKGLICPHSHGFNIISKSPKGEFLLGSYGTDESPFRLNGRICVDMCTTMVYATILNYLSSPYACSMKISPMLFSRKDIVEEFINESIIYMK